MAELKEKLSSYEKLDESHKVEIEQPKVEERSLEVESVIEKLERQTKADNRQQDVDDDVNQNTVVVASDDQPAVTLPITQDDMIKGKQLSIKESLRWLTEWAWRQVKKFSGRVKYREER